MKLNRDRLTLKWFICFLFRRHKWICTCDDTESIYDLTCVRCGLSIKGYAKRLDYDHRNLETPET